MTCRNCIRKEIAKLGLCFDNKAEDGLPVRCTGSWSKLKLDILERYINIFTISMRDKWEKLNYIDLFAGPGKCFDYQNYIFYDSSPLIAAKHHQLFDKLIFVDKNKKVLDILKERLRGLQNAEFVLGDCNDKIDFILDIIPKRSLSIFFVDPTGLQFKFSTLNKIINSKRGNNDIIELFPYEMAIKLNLTKWQKQGKSKALDEYLGVIDSIKELGVKKNYYYPIINMYKKSIGPNYSEDYSSKSMRSGKNVPLYHLFYISRHSLGKKFFKKALNSTKGQGTLF